MLEEGLPQPFWFVLCCAAVFLTNRTITKAVQGFRTPFEVGHFRKPTVSHLRVVGCLAYRLI